MVVKHYQWMVRSDYLPRVVKPQLVDRVFTEGRKVFETSPVPGDSPTMPVEFSVATFRLGHSMIRSAYDWNHVFDDGGGSLDLLFTFSGTSGALGGSPRLPSNWIADFRRLYDFTEAGRNDLRPIVNGENKMNFARRMDRRLTDFLASPPAGSSGGPAPKAIRHNLAFRNLTRGHMLKLATGQQMVALMRARGVTLTALTAKQIIDGNRGAKLSALNPAQRQRVATDTPLWFYALREAEFNAGRLAAVGGRLVGEVVVVTHAIVEGSGRVEQGDSEWLARGPDAGPGTRTYLTGFRCVRGA